MNEEVDQTATQAAGSEEASVAAPASLSRRDFVNAQEPAGLLDAPAIARLIGTSVGTIRNWTAAGDIPAIRLKSGRLVRYSWPHVLQALLRTQRASR